MLTSHVDASILADINKKLASVFSKTYQTYIRGVSSDVSQLMNNIYLGSYHQRGKRGIPKELLRSPWRYICQFVCLSIIICEGKTQMMDRLKEAKSDATLFSQALREPLPAKRRAEVGLLF